MSTKKLFHADALRRSTQAGVSGWMQCLLWLLTLVVIAVAILLQRPPVALDATAPASQFSSARALAQLSPLAQRPHPPGSADHVRVREALVRAF
ncbi:MAG: hypothetical protein L0H70_09395, partial [Xanthomonadales bacterium]|nr:hypothetical protein [Xanthomonadales bacterium]